MLIFALLMMLLGIQESYKCHIGNKPINCLQGCRYLETDSGFNVSLGCAYNVTKGFIFDYVVDVKHDMGPTVVTDDPEVRFAYVLYVSMMRQHYPNLAI
jgi:hypothetical protein